MLIKIIKFNSMLLVKYANMEANGNLSRARTAGWLARSALMPFKQQER
jgi:hypothetical protein